jgi:hypothetical protein
MTTAESLIASVNKIADAITLSINPELQFLLKLAETASNADPEQPVAPTDLHARLYPENGKLTVELVFTATDNVGQLETTFEVQRDDDITDNVPNWHNVGTVPAGGSLWEEHLDSLQDVSYAYRVRGVKVNNGVTYYSAWSNVADPAPFVIDDGGGTVDPAGRTIVQPGFNFTGKTGKYFLKNGTYPSFDPESNLDLLGESRDGVVIKPGSGKQFLHRGATNVFLDNLTIDGEGKAGGATKLNDKCMFGPGDNWKVKRTTVKGAIGVGVGCDGSGIRFTDVTAFNNGSAGIGGKAKGSIFLRVNCYDNNNTVKDRDGATFGKFTRTEGQLFIDCSAKGGTCAAIWHDINNCNIVYIRFLIDGIKLCDNSRAWTGAGFKEEISESKAKAFATILALCKEANVLRATESIDGVTEDELKNYNYNYRNCIAKGTASYPVDWNETKDVFWLGGEIEESKNTSEGGSIGVRDLPRSDAAAKGQADNWVLGNIFVKNVKATTGTFTFWGSGAGNKLSMTKYKIRYEGITGLVKLKNIAA